ncbi:MAG: alpha/beta hydrolase [Balneolaceae bacterium]|nr:alpha/beta hydrolase [Balneolaceae bacterium]
MTKRDELTIDPSDPRVKAARSAEERLHRHHHLSCTEHRIELDEPEIRIRVLEAGRGAPVILMPGGIGDAWIWSSLMGHMEGFRMIAVNRPGGGLSDGVDHRDVDLRTLATDTLSAVLDHFELTSAPIIANSMGGLWSFWFALDRPERVRALAQVGTPALILGTSAPLPMRLQSIPGLNRLLVKLMVPKNLEQARDLPTFLGHPESVGEEWPEAAAACSYHFSRLPTFTTSWLSLMERVLTPTGAEADVRIEEEELRQVSQPTLFLWGSGDPFGSLEVARRAERAVPDARLLEVGVGHLPWWDEAGECARLIEKFFSDKAEAVNPD